MVRLFSLRKSRLGKLVYKPLSFGGDRHLRRFFAMSGRWTTISSRSVRIIALPTPGGRETSGSILSIASLLPTALRCARVVVHSNPLKEAASMEEVGIIGIDLAKHSFQLRGVRADGSGAFHRKLSRAKVPDFLVSRPRFAVVLALLLLVLAMDPEARADERLWNVICGLPQQDNPILALLPTGGYTGPWFGDPRSGHLEVKMLNRSHPKGGLSTEMWLLSRSVGWWRLKAIRVHPDDVSKFTGNAVEDLGKREIRQIIDSPFLSRPTVVRAGNPDEEEVVNGQILALLPDASQLRCGPQSNGSDVARIAAAQRALARHGHDPGLVDGRMGPRTRAALRAFQTEHGLTPHGQLDDATFEQLR